MSLPRFEPVDAADYRVVGEARAAVAAGLAGAGRDDLVDEARLVTSELVTNAVLHARGCTGVELIATEDGFRIEVADRTHTPPIFGHATEQSMTGRGLRLVARLSRAWGVRQTDDGKVVWAEVPAAEETVVAPEVEEDELLATFDDAWVVPRERRELVRVTLGDVPTDLLLDAKAHVDNLVREFALAAAGARSGETEEVPEHLASLIETVTTRFAEARLAIKHQALEAERRGEPETRLELLLPIETADAAEDYLEALDEADAYCRAMRLLTLETPPQHRVFRRWYIEEIVAQLRAAPGKPAPPPEPFEKRLLKELDTVAAAQRAAQRAARLSSVARSLAVASDPEEVAHGVLIEGVAALGASGGGVLLATASGEIQFAGSVGYGEDVVARLRSESPDAELPAAVALRTGEPVWLESRQARDERFPELVGLERTTVSMCAVPLIVQGRRLGALRFSFSEARLFDEDERLFVLVLAAQTAQALERAQLQHQRAQVAERLQHSLLPPDLPKVPGLEIAAVYHPLGAGVEAGGDFYDVWEISPGRFGVAIGDASGTGPEAAALTALVRHTLRAVAMFEEDPRRMLHSLNNALLRASSDESDERFCTAIFGVFSVTGGGVHAQLASGGHPYPFLRRRQADVDEIVLGGSLLGVFPTIEVVTREVVLRPGDLLVLLTDGVLECHRNGDFFDVAGVRRILQQAEAGATGAAGALEAAVLEHCGGQLEDDMAVLALAVRDDA